MMYSFDRDGNLLDRIDVSIEEMRGVELFEGWRSSFGKKEYFFDEFSYVYKAPTIFRHSAELCITNGEKEIILYQD